MQYEVARRVDYDGDRVLRMALIYCDGKHPMRRPLTWEFGVVGVLRRPFFLVDEIPFGLARCVWR